MGTTSVLIARERIGLHWPSEPDFQRAVAVFLEALGIGLSPAAPASLLLDGRVCVAVQGPTVPDVPECQLVVTEAYNKGALLWRRVRLYPVGPGWT